MDSGPSEARLKVYRIGPPLSLSQVLPALSSMGVEVVDEPRGPLRVLVATDNSGCRLVLIADVRHRPPADPADAAVILVHDYTGSRQQMLPLVQPLHRVLRPRADTSG